MGSVLVGLRSVVGRSGGAGEERHERSSDSTAGNGFCAAIGGDDSRFSVSGSADTDFDLRRRGDVCRLCAIVSAVLEFLRRDGFDAVDSAEIEEELEDIEVRGGRPLAPAAVRLEAVQ